MDQPIKVFLSTVKYKEKVNECGSAECNTTGIGFKANATAMVNASTDAETIPRLIIKANGDQT